MRRLGSLVAAAIVVGWPVSAGADPQGCSVVAPNPSGGGNCRYTATGPGVYSARAPIGGWRIMASSDGGQTWRTLAFGRPVIHDGTPGYPEPLPAWYLPDGGAIDTRFGDLVDVSMGKDFVCPPAAGCQVVRAGILEARDRTP